METLLNWIFETNIQAALIGLIAGAWLQKRAVKQTLKKEIDIAIDDIQAKSHDHWCGSGDDNDNNARIVTLQSQIQQLGKRLNLRKHNTGEAFREFREAITGDDFSDESRQTLNFDNPKIKLIEAKTDNLKKFIKLK